MKVLTVTICLACVAGLNGEDTSWTNGDDWLKWDLGAKAAYVMAVEDTSAAITGAAQVIAQGKLRSQDMARLEKLPNRYFANFKLKVGTTIEAIDRLYSLPENRNISVLAAMEIVAARFNGATDSCISEMLVWGRLRSTNPTQEKLTAEATRVIRICGPDWL